MGEANIRFARGEHEEAILMCMEIIRQGVSCGDYRQVQFSLSKGGFHEGSKVESRGFHEITLWLEQRML